jgi:hypothetical protein
MPKVTMNQRVLHDDSANSGVEVFEENGKYDVSDELADYFAGQGWIVGSERPDAPTITIPESRRDIKPENSNKTIDLDIHSTVHHSSVVTKDKPNG